MAKTTSYFYCVSCCPYLTIIFSVGINRSNNLYQLCTEDDFIIVVINLEKAS